MTEDKLKINANDYRLIADAIKTAPIDPLHTEINFNMCGLEIPYESEKNKEQIKRYTAQCGKLRIIPYSRATIQSLGGKIEYASKQFFEKGGPVLNGLLQDFKPHNINIKLEAKHFPILKDNILDKLLKKRYQITYANLVFSTYHIHDHYTSGDYADAQAYSYHGNDLELLLGRGTEMMPEQKKMVLDWFNELKEKYDKKN